MAMAVRDAPEAMRRADFIDADGEACSIQESAFITTGAEGDKPGPHLWLGRNAGDHPRDRHPTCHARMHLTRERAAELLPLLLAFVETGKLPEPPEEDPTW